MSSSSTNSDNENEITPKYEQSDVGNGILNQHLPAKSRMLYMKTYENFEEWKNLKRAKSCSESVLLAYFQDLAKSKKPSTLWSTYSMLKNTIRSKKNIKIETYTKLLAFLKRLAKGHKSKKSRVLSAENVEMFLKEAPDIKYLDMKVALIFGLNGACRGAELLNIKIDDIQRHSDQLLLVNVYDTKRKMGRTFVIRDEFKKIVEKYLALRPPDMPNNRFFINYQNGKCHKQVIGINKIGSIPKQIAHYLKLPNPELYTGHCFRRTSASLLGNPGVDLSILKQRSGWSSYTPPESNVNDFLDSMPKETSHNEAAPVPETAPSLSVHPSTLQACETPEENDHIIFQEQDSQNTSITNFLEPIEIDDEVRNSKTKGKCLKTKDNNDFDDDDEQKDKEPKKLKKLSDEYQIFGDFVASELRSMHYPKNRRALKRTIQLQVVHWTELDDNEYLKTWRAPRRDKSSKAKTKNRCHGGDETDNSIDPLIDLRSLKEEM